jgi:hypothetical protein
VIRGLDGFILRDLGSFHLKGKRSAIKIFEIVARVGDIDDDMEALLRRFADALAIWQRGERLAARQAFRALHDDYPADGPTGYYLSRVTPEGVDNDNTRG